MQKIGASPMATEVEVPRPRSLLPPYPEMILAAISALSEKDGATKSSIAEYIESAHGIELPKAHSSLLAAHLARMAEIGELVVVNGCFFRAGPGAPLLKRGRGRPPKNRLAVSGDSATQTAVPSDDGAAAAAPRRPRGRPPKPVDPLAPVKVPRPRGRPPKNPKVGDDGAGGLAFKRPKGRPPKVPPQFAEVGFV